MFHHIEEALKDLKKGKVIIVCDDQNRENEGDFIALAEYITPETINFMITHGRGLICVPITPQYAERLQLEPMVSHNTDTHRTAFTVSIDHISTTTGISAHERAMTIRKLLDPTSKGTDFNRPGHIFPLIANAGGTLCRAGHTEAAVDLAKLCGAEPVGVICEIISKNGTMARVPELMQCAKQFDLKIITIEDLISYRRHRETLITREVEITLPTDVGTFHAIGYSNTLDTKEHIVLVKGDISSLCEPVLVRVHSECLTGDVFGSCRCDCGPQLHAALTQIEREGKGILIYMRQEGRGIGLLNKLKAYKLQERGLDTVEANEKLGFPADLRDYIISAQILKDLGVYQLRLLTNNPKKIASLQEYDLKVIERIPLQVPTTKENKTYLETKVTKLGHLLNL
ncbi:bifunctional 3,4-dihydroxy-2-butanone-4-phosphate synthase/GTP cyclohydrolase II [Bacillus toyonensis]|uniref:bifunctional 3,4-dihydroxy-2-butanone-4-phosphate synthase/GTP cyclohydrolase II n=1 Tax=Bacillus toyonensis TaxID=155322 RepID=UPI002E210819|nr:bifunctional 3,4-dihydroxy-2-butanone-4-phosphate synthase/GTP cyclohydrolase II [Bacillus toyonensis]MED3088052.1 bifunctional 3,4-dihydroxy-2-butanone-4-phosphate synthase/GTP cyclohydrolase II [Bacillus toyonensis]